MNQKDKLKDILRNKKRHSAPLFTCLNHWLALSRSAQVNFMFRDHLRELQIQHDAGLLSDLEVKQAANKLVSFQQNQMEKEKMKEFAVDSEGREIFDVEEMKKSFLFYAKEFDIRPLPPPQQQQTATAAAVISQSMTSAKGSVSASSSKSAEIKRKSSKNISLTGQTVGSNALSSSSSSIVSASVAASTTTAGVRENTHGIMFLARSGKKIVVYFLCDNRNKKVINKGSRSGNHQHGNRKNINNSDDVQSHAEKAMEILQDTNPELFKKSISSQNKGLSVVFQYSLLFCAESFATRFQFALLGSKRLSEYEIDTPIDGGAGLCIVSLSHSENEFLKLAAVCEHIIPSQAQLRQNRKGSVMRIQKFIRMHIHIAVSQKDIDKNKKVKDDDGDKNKGNNDNNYYYDDDDIIKELENMTLKSDNKNMHGDKKRSKQKGKKKQQKKNFKKKGILNDNINNNNVDLPHHSTTEAEISASYDYISSSSDKEEEENIEDEISDKGESKEVQSDVEDQDESKERYLDEEKEDVKNEMYIIKLQMWWKRMMNIKVLHEILVNESAMRIQMLYRRCLLEKRIKRRKLFKKLQTGLSKSSLYENITKDILEFTTVVMDISAKNQPVISMLVEKIRAVCRDVVPFASLHQYGSTCTGLSLPSSDIDLVLTLQGGSIHQPWRYSLPSSVFSVGTFETTPHMPRTQALPSYLRPIDYPYQYQVPDNHQHILSLLEVLRFQSWVSHAQIVGPHSMPIIRMSCAVQPLVGWNSPNPALNHQLQRKSISSSSSSSNSSSTNTAAASRSVSYIKVDISIWHPGHTGLRCVNLVNEFLMSHPYHLRPLVLVIKQLLHDHKLDSTHLGGLSSYSILLLVVCFLRYQVPNTTSSIRGNETLGELLVMLLDTYQNESFFKEYGIDIFGTSPSSLGVQGFYELGNLEERTEDRSPPIIIHDPLFPSNNIASGSYSIRHIQQLFRKIRDLLLSSSSSSLSASVSSLQHHESKISSPSAPSVDGGNTINNTYTNHDGDNAGNPIKSDISKSKKQEHSSTLRTILNTDRFS